MSDGITQWLPCKVITFRLAGCLRRSGNLAWHPIPILGHGGEAAVTLLTDQKLLKIFSLDLDWRLERSFCLAAHRFPTRLEGDL